MNRECLRHCGATLRICGLLRMTSSPPMWSLVGRLHAISPASSHKRRPSAGPWGEFWVSGECRDTIGSGILRTSGGIARHLGSYGFILAVCIFGGVYALSCTLAVTELETMLPFAGGWYVYSRRGHGRFPRISGGIERCRGADGFEASQPQIASD